MSALNLINDVLNTGTLQAKRNALTALRIVGTQESIGKLVSAAVTSDVDLRERAVAEIQQLDAARTELAKKSLREEAQNPRTRDLAYRVYGILGWRIDGTIRSRIRNALRLAGTLYRGQSWRAYSDRILPDAWFAAALAAVLLSVALMTVLDLIPRGMGEIFLWSSLIAIALSAVGAWRVSPIGLQSAGGWPALATEIVLPGLTVFAVAAVLSLAVLGSISTLADFEGLSASTALFAALALGATVSAVRAGSALAHRLFGRQLLDTLAPTVAGASAGIVVLSATIVWLRPGLAVSTSADVPAASTFSGVLAANAFSYADYAWPALACAAFGIAAGFSRIDARSPLRKRSALATALRGTASFAIVGSVAIAGVFAFARAGVPVDARVSLDEIPDREIRVEHTPFLIRLDGSNSDAAATNLVSLAAIEETYDDLVLRWYDDSKVLLADADSPVQVQLDLETDQDYWLAVLRYSEPSQLDSAANEVAELFPALMTAAFQPVVPHTESRLNNAVTLRFEPPLAFEDTVDVAEERRHTITQIPYVLPIRTEHRGPFSAELLDLPTLTDLTVQIYDANGEPLTDIYARTSFRQRLDPGTYYVAVISYTDQESYYSISNAVKDNRTQALLSMRTLDEPVEMSLQLRKPTTGPWQLGVPAALPIDVRVTEVPFSASFTLTDEATINAEVGSHIEDLLLTIYDESGVERAYGDDPPEARQILPAGSYYAVVSLYGDEELFSIPESLSAGNRFVDVSRFPLRNAPRLTIQASAPQRVSLALIDAVLPTEPFEIAALPFILPLSLTDGERLIVDADIDETALDLVVDLYSEDGLLYATQDDPPILDARVDGDAYYVVVREYGVLDQGTSVVDALQRGEQSVALMLDNIPPVMISVRIEQ